MAIVSLAEDVDLLLNICPGDWSCRLDDPNSYLKLTPPKFDPHIYEYNIYITDKYPFYHRTNPVTAEIFIRMNVSHGFQDSVIAKSVLYDALGKRILTMTDFAYSSDEMMLMSALLWKPQDRVSGIDTNDQLTTQLVVYRFNGTMPPLSSPPYTIKFRRNQ
ncbi:unnamed protein product [Rotaria sp. Silwood1]|nr:unnamed protein product [Rotaria sp. Silwood1]